MWLDWATHRGSSTQSKGHKEITMETICSTEKIHNNACIFKPAMLGMATRQGLNHVIGPHPEDNTHCTQSRTKTELEHLCLVEAGRRFTQVSTTPFLQCPLLDLFTKANLSSKVFDQVLDRTFKCLADTDEMARHLLRALK